MKELNELIDDSRALKHLMDLLAIEGISGREGKVAAAVQDKLRDAGCKRSWMRHDGAHRRIPREFQRGNLIVKIPGGVRAPRRLFMAHLDTVPLCKGAVPVRRGGRIVSRRNTALGADNRTAVACLVTLVETLLKHDLPRPPLTILFTVGEEVGLLGARHVRLADLGRPKLGFNVDSGNPRDLIIGAVGADRWEVEIVGRSSHAGVHPEDGVSAIVIASRAVHEVVRRGYFGKVVKGKKRGTSNVGVFRGGEATNQVAHSVRLWGESRSHDPAFVGEINGVYRRAFEKAASSVKNRRGQAGRAKFRSRTEYKAFLMDEDSPPVRLALRRARWLGLRLRLLVSNGGLDANCLNAKKVPTVTLGAGQHNAHTVDEYADIKEYLTGCRLTLALASELPR